MRNRALRRTAIVLFAAVIVQGCTKDMTPTAPTTNPSAPSVPAPSPAAATATLSGRVTEAPPTTLTGVGEAIVTLTNGTDAWRSAPTPGGPGGGAYSISGLRPGTYRASIAAAGFVTIEQDVTIAGTVTMNFRLLPVMATKTLTVSGEIQSTGGTCSDGTSMKPCHVIAIPIHNAGAIDATLTWQAGGPVALCMTLFDASTSVPLAKSTSMGSADERMAARLPGGQLYEIRITYASGTATPSYSLKVAYPN